MERNRGHHRVGRFGRLVRSCHRADHELVGNECRHADWSRSLRNGSKFAGGNPGAVWIWTPVTVSAVSLYARENYVDRNVLDQSSIIRFIEDNWRLGRIGNGSFDQLPASVKLCSTSTINGTIGCFWTPPPARSRPFNTNSRPAFPAISEAAGVSRILRDAPAVFFALGILRTLRLRVAAVNRSNAVTPTPYGNCRDGQRDREALTLVWLSLKRSHPEKEAS